MLVELVVAMSFLAIAVSALIAVFASSAISLRNAGIEGTALTLADSQVETYKTISYGAMKVDAATIPGGGDPYVTANASDATIPPSTGQVTGGTVGTSACAAATTPLSECATQTLTGPDNRTYRIDTYVHEASGVKKVTVAVRQMIGGSPGPIKARATTAFDPANPPA